MEHYQDIWVKGNVIRPGKRECASISKGLMAKKNVIIIQIQFYKFFLSPML